MKTLTTYIKEDFKLSHKTEIHKEYTQIFKFKVKKANSIQIVSTSWSQFNEYRDKIYVNGENIKIGDGGYTIKIFQPGTYDIYIKDVDKVTNCNSMFWWSNCLISVPKFDTSNVSDMRFMFNHCENLEDVPLLDTRSVELNKMDYMFDGSKKLSIDTKKRWSALYDFSTDKQK